MKTKEIAAMVLLLTVGLLVGCGSYAEVSPEAYQSTKALYSICNRKDAAQLDKMADQTATARAESKFTSKEADWINDIIDTARTGDWQSATKKARQLMEAQVKGR